ncbi:P-loop containing nucleoside triphosphate hydrolase protein [Polychytrium aggregatum]|uniref:P-loop containing nucleoside triphosphate hydrolase protein n=1 Tax=Polychytrium aggregatum TaxID=110093 RepID=UPI0022FEFB99|nr:P-loop containing nucleoside triphosphate hydrolase protein [Polychytrium aggregatum]KAI9202954.1 P-loop containing nucleoside triphosphate hydrolase protein [Polychytrium aggregatum]
MTTPDPLAVEKALKDYSKGTKAYFADDSEGWSIATLQSNVVDGDKLTLSFRLDATGKEFTFSSSLSKLAAEKFAGLPPLKNPPMLEGTDDLATLSYLHEPAVLDGVRIRYAQEQIYTYSGIVLIAMNPFQRLAIYTPDIMREYSGKSRGELEPHLFAVAEEAYRTMIKERKNQSIIVSGESGAGKTQSAKYIMRYFATVDTLESFSRQTSSDNVAAAPQGISEVEEAVLATNPIMESFGNSKTTRNDNSSRFGKYIEILFSTPEGPKNSVRIVGAKIRTYLLERSRLIFQPATERNYHIFYQLCAAAPAAERKELGLSSWDQFFYLKQGGTGIVPGFDDVAEFAATQKALSIIGISVSMQWQIFTICAALLHIGNIEIKSVRDEATIDDNDPALIQTCQLLQVDKSAFKKWIIKKQIITRSEKIVSNLNQYQAIVGRDSIAKFIYSMLFDWIVKIVNKNLHKDAEDVATFIGVLDIYGFEHFKKNSFEQFCINYANEKLQQEFNAHVFRLEQEIYVQEKINWSFIDFNDNQPCINMIENKMGILDLLDEESRLPSGADKSLVTKLYQRFAVPTEKFFEKPKFGQTAFTIKHYACDVTYDIEGFIEKNKDTVADEQLAVLNDGASEFLKEVIHIDVPDAALSPKPGPRGGATKKPTLGSIFKASLVQLMETMRTTEAHYIRCIKPNSTKTPFGFESPMVLQQLRACGVLETIRISCAGYPSKYSFAEFAERYYPLVASKLWGPDPKKLTESIVASRISDPDKFQVGLTKIFFRAGQVAALEKARTERIRYCVVLIQTNMRRYLYQKRYKAIVQAALTVQTSLRAWSARESLKEKREQKAAVVIQTSIRTWLSRSYYEALRSAALSVQCALRVQRARKQLIDLRQNTAATRIQKVFRGFIVRRDYKLYLAQVVLVQSWIRTHAPILELRQLKTEARSVGKLQETNTKLENKVVELSMALRNQESENKVMAEKLAQFEHQSSIWKEKFQKADLDSKAVKVEFVDNSAEFKKEIAELKDVNENLSKEAERAKALAKKRDEEIATLLAELRQQKDEVQKLKEAAAKVVPKEEDTATITALKKEVAALKEQVSRQVAGKWKTDRVADAQYQQAPSYHQPQYQTTYVDEKENYLYSSYGEPPSRPSLDETKRPSVARRRSFMDTQDLKKSALSSLNPEAERSARALEDKGLEDEINDALITNLRIPLPSTQTVATRKEIFFPAHLIGTVVSQYMQRDMPHKMQTTMASVMKSIQNLTMKFEDDYVSAFWLSNTFELLCLIKSIQEQEKRSTRGSTTESDRAIDKVRTEMDYLLIEIYHGWIKELKKRLTNMIVPAVIENQSLPGYICKQSGGLWSKWGKNSTASQFTIEQLLNLLSKLSKTMRCYYMEDTMSRQILTELLRVIGVSAFNHLLMRKNFCTWKRGVQIQYNVSRLEEWCTSHGIAEATLHLQQLLQAAKLLTLNKTSPQDIETIFDVCFLLNPTQIKKLLSLYYAADFDSPLSPELLKIVASRAVLNEKSDILLLDLELSPEFVKPNLKNVENIERFIPSWTNLPEMQNFLLAM